jgi:hypothetical protein
MRTVITVLSLYVLSFVGPVGIFQFRSELGGWTSILMMAFFLAIGLVIWRIQCPVCAKPIILREGSRFGIATPFPEIVCSRCGTILIPSLNTNDSRKDSE